MAVDWRWLNWGVGDCSLWRECDDGCWLKRSDRPIMGYHQDVPVLCRLRAIDEPVIYHSDGRVTGLPAGATMPLSRPSTFNDWGRDPGSHVVFERKFAIIDLLQAMKERGRPVMAGLRFVNHTGEPFLIAHFPGYSILEHYPAMRTFEDAVVSLPGNIAIVTFATANVMREALLLHQLDRAGIPYINAAAEIAPETWENARKPEWLCQALPAVDTEYVLVLDSLDVLLVGDLAPIIERFAAYDHKVLFGSTKAPHPLFYVGGTSEGKKEFGAFCYLNAGTAFGRTADVFAFYQRAAAIRERLEDINDRRSEQLIIRTILAEDGEDAGFDWRCSIFQLFGNASVEQDGLRVRIF